MANVPFFYKGRVFIRVGHADTLGTVAFFQSSKHGENGVQGMARGAEPADQERSISGRS